MKHERNGFIMTDTQKKIGKYTLRELKGEPVLEVAEYSRLAAAEGSVLLKNEKATLPFIKGEKLSVFGRIQSTYYKSGTGSGGMVNVKYCTNILDSLRDGGVVKIDEELAKIYADWIKENPFEVGFGWASEPWSQKEMPLSDDVAGDAAKRSDKALIVIGRTAGEDQDNSNKEGSYLLNETEYNMIKTVCRHFEKVAVVLNVGNVIDLNFADELGVSALLYSWQGGFEGGNACADLLCGKITPSGKLSDTCAKSVSSCYADKNYGGRYRNFYEEDIYVGYRYFETFDKESVLYPFGFGLSYTKFALSGVNARREGDNVVIKAEVKNIGDYAGKEVIEVYYEAPQGVLGKPLRALSAFKKTGELKPNESEQVELSFPISAMASYDESGETGNRSCYVLESGEYNIYVGTDVRSAEKAGSFTIDKTIVTQQLREACAPVTPFDIIRPKKVGSGYVPELRAAHLGKNDTLKIISDEMPQEIAPTGDKGCKLVDVARGNCTLDEFIAQLSDEELGCLTVGEGMNSVRVTPGTAAAFGGVTTALEDRGIPACCCTDGPSGLRLDDGAPASSIPNGTALACTWNTELIEKLYNYFGAEAYSYNIDALLGPGINIHRHPLNGRNFEYLSEDPYLTGVIASAMTKGFSLAGTQVTIKHFAANNQEHFRYNTDSIVSERALREIYLKPFEICVKNGAKSVMTTYNPLNGWWNAGNYELCTRILRDEWGFDGIVMTDWWAVMNEYAGGPSEHHIMHAMIRSQNDLLMPNPTAGEIWLKIKKDLDEGKLNRAQIQRCVKNILSFVLESPTFAKYVENGCKPISPIGIDTENLKSVYSFGDIAPDKEFEIDLDSDQTVAFGMTYDSKQPLTAQIKFTVSCDGKQVAAMMGKGSLGEVHESFSRSTTLSAGKHKISLGYSRKLATVYKLEILQ